MKAASVRDIRNDLKQRSHEELVDACLRMAKFKKDNKELLTYLLFHADDESGYVADVKDELNEQFDDLRGKSFYHIRKGIQKILRGLKKRIRYSKEKETEVVLLIHFCRKVLWFKILVEHNQALRNLYFRQIDLARKRAGMLHEDLQYDYGQELDELEEKL